MEWAGPRLASMVRAGLARPGVATGSAAGRARDAGARARDARVRARDARVRARDARPKAQCCSTSRMDCGGRALSRFAGSVVPSRGCVEECAGGPTDGTKPRRASRSPSPRLHFL